MGYLSQCPFCMGFWMGILCLSFSGALDEGLWPYLGKVSLVSLGSLVLVLLMDLLAEVQEWVAGAVARSKESKEG